MYDEKAALRYLIQEQLRKELLRRAGIVTRSTWNEETKQWEPITPENDIKVAGSYITRDSGQRREFPTGSVRDVRTGKGRFDLLWWPFIQRMAGIMERGAEKYGDRNWEKGQPVMSSYDSSMRHLGQAGQGLEDEDHLAAVAVNAMFMAFTIEMARRGVLPSELDDRPENV